MAGTAAAGGSIKKSCYQSSTSNLSFDVRSIGSDQSNLTEAADNKGKLS